MRFGIWAELDGTGEGFDSSTGFKLPNGATRSPDVAWVRRERLAALTPQQTERFIPLCPDFVVELRSSSDRLSPVKKKMEEYMANGARLGWLLDLLGEHRLADALAAALEGERLVPTPLSTARDASDAPLDARWRILVNDEVEPDL